MPNVRLRNALIAAGITQAELAEKAQVDAKSVERWITQDRLPHPATRARVANALGEDESYFWPALLGTEQSRATTQSELVQLWPTRQAVPGDVWRTLFRQAERQIDVLVYSGGFLIEAYDLVEVIQAKASAGVRFRILLGDSHSEAVHQRAREERLPALVNRCESSREYLADVIPLPGVQVRLHGTILYASQFRFDESMLVNNHTYGSQAARSPVMHLRHVPGGQLFDYYDRSFERVWAKGQPVPMRPWDAAWTTTTTQTRREPTASDPAQQPSCSAISVSC
jgi:transcriptional regulator with XRE-family HTH domain